jgi:hypothetical protein
MSNATKKASPTRIVRATPNGAAIICPHCGKVVVLEVSKG